MYTHGKDRMKLDIKTLIMIITFAATMGGFYYTTQLRLDHVEENIATIEKKIKRLNRAKKVKTR